MTIDMEYKLTCKVQCSKKCADGKKRNYLLYFLNGVQILRQKFPYDEGYDKGFDKRTAIYDEYLLNGSLHQTRKHWHGCSQQPRQVRYPISKAKIQQFDIPQNHRIEISDYEPQPVPRRVQPAWGGGMFGPEPWEQ
jgi:hypothetical protein